MNFIAKQFMNSLYGRFGMDINFNEFIIVSYNEMIELTKNNDIIIKDIFNLDDDYVILIQKKNNNHFNMLPNHNVNIAVASKSLC